MLATCVMWGKCFLVGCVFVLSSFSFHSLVDLPVVPKFACQLGSIVRDGDPPCTVRGTALFAK